MRLLDLFCGAGGAAVGYYQAGFTEIVGVDIMPQPNYPFEFIQGDALHILASLGRHAWRPGTYDLIHASPPCQHFTAYGRVHKDLAERYENHLPETRRLLQQYDVPWVIENVPGAPMRVDVELCGSMFGLDSIQRHRWFELSWADELIMAPPHNHLAPRRFKSHRTPVGGQFKDRPLSTRVLQIGSWSEPLELQKQAMGVDWPITVRELSEAIPPAYTKFIGEAFMLYQQNIEASNDLLASGDF